MRWHRCQEQIGATRWEERGNKSEGLVEGGAEELSQSTIRVRDDARGRVRRPCRNRLHVVMVAAQKHCSEPDPSCRGHAGLRLRRRVLAAQAEVRHADVGPRYLYASRRCATRTTTTTMVASSISYRTR